jgi:acetyl esterase/lipase
MKARSHVSLAFCVAAGAVLAGGAAAAQTLKKTADIEYARVAGRSLKLDLYELEGTSGAPLLVWVHGGRWEVGSKEPMPLTALVERGFAIASLDFSPASMAPFPGQVHEIKAAVRILRSQAATYGYDATQLGILGASSGGHLAALVGVTNGHPELEGALGDHRDASSDVQAIVSYFGASNLTTILKQSTPFGLNIRTPSVKTLLGAAPEDNDAIARLASPVFHVDASDPPLLLLHGDQDPQMPINQSHELQGAYEERDLDGTFVVVHGAVHGGDQFFDEPRSELVSAFLDAHLRRELTSDSAQR